MRATLDFVMGLEQAASKLGGRVVPLLGNHEVMNLTGDLRYVVPANYAEFADAGSEKRRAAAWRQVLDQRKRRARKLGQPEPPSGKKRAKPGSRRTPATSSTGRLSGPGGAYGRWLRARPAVFVAEGTAFLHGGLSPALAGTSLAEIDRRVHEDLATFDADRARFLAEGLILPFFDLQETAQAVREELAALTAAQTAARAAAEQAGRRTRRPPRTPNGGRSTSAFSPGELDHQFPRRPPWFRGFGQWSDTEARPSCRGSCRPPASSASSSGTRSGRMGGSASASAAPSS